MRQKKSSCEYKNAGFYSSRRINLISIWSFNSDIYHTGRSRLPRPPLPHHFRRLEGGLVSVQVYLHYGHLGDGPARERLGERGDCFNPPVEVLDEVIVVLAVGHSNVGGEFQGRVDVRAAFGVHGGHVAGVKDAATHLPHEENHFVFDSSQDVCDISFLLCACMCVRERERMRERERERERERGRERERVTISHYAPMYGNLFINHAW